MFEKEAEEYAEGMAKYYESTHDFIPSQFEKYLRNAVKYGYNKANDKIEALEERCEIANDEIIRLQKANEWHYPSKGELPKEDTPEYETLYLLWFGIDDSNYMAGLFSHGRFWCFHNGWYETNEITAWKEIVRPKEIKEK